MSEKRPEPLKLPDLQVEKLFYLEASCAPIIPIGDIGTADLNIYPILEGYFEGEKLKGEVLNFGADWNYKDKDRVAVMDTRYLLKTDDGAHIAISSLGRCVDDIETYKAITSGQFVDPSKYYFRQHIFFQTGAEKYKWLNGIIAFAVMGVSETGKICYNAYMLK